MIAFSLLFLSSVCKQMIINVHKEICSTLQAYLLCITVSEEVAERKREAVLALDEENTVGIYHTSSHLAALILGN